MLARADGIRAAVDRGHRRLASAEIWTPGGMVGTAPINRGYATVSLSAARGQRSGSMVVPGYDWWPRLDPTTVCWARLGIAVDGVPFDLGEFPITRAAASRPGGLVTCTLGDWAFRLARGQVESAATITGSLAAAVSAALSDAMGLPVTVVRDDSGGAHVASPYEVPVGGNMWTELTAAANELGCVVVHVSRTTAEIRNFDLGGGPVELLDGTLHRSVSGVDADAAVNRVVVVAEGADGAVFRAVRTLDSGPYRYGGPFGRSALVDVLTVRSPTQALVDAAADRLARRLFGIVRSLELSVMAMPWLQVGDRVRVSTAHGVEEAQVETITYPLTVDEPMTIRTRDRSDITGGGG